MVLKEVVIPTYTVAISYLVIVIVYLYRYILHPPKSDNGIEDPQETTDCSGETADLKGPREISGDGKRNDVAHCAVRNMHVSAPGLEVTLEWSGICLDMKHVGLPKNILQDCSGSANSKDLTAFMGPSGAGKSSLLDVLAGRIKPTAGTVLVNGKAQTSQFLSHAAYVAQESHFLPTLSVWETLTFHSYLRLPENSQNHKLLMQETLHSMGLFSIRHSRVGGVLPGGIAVKGISGGEKRRLHVCCEIVAAPSVVFLDEPTSGLDSHAALGLLGHIRRLARRGCTVLITVHQPNPMMWELFDNLLVLAEGFTLYCGPPSRVVPYFKKTFNFEFDPAVAGAPADWLLNLVAVNFKASERARHCFKTVADLQNAARAWSSQQATSAASPADAVAATCAVSKGGLVDTDGNLDAGTVASIDWGTAGSAVGGTSGNTVGGGAGGLVRPSYPTSTWNQLRVMFWFSILQYSRNPADVARRVLAGLLLGTLTGLLFINTIAPDGSLRILTFMALIFFTILMCLMIHITTVGVYVADKLHFVTDAPSHIYGPLPYFVAQTVVALPFYISSCMVLLLTIFGLVGLRTAADGLSVFLLLGCLVNLVGHQVFVFSVYITPIQDAALILGIMYCMLSLLVAGFFVKWRDMQPFWRWVSYATPCRYGVAGIVENLLQGTPYAPLAKDFGMTWSVGANVGALLVLYGVLLLMNFASLCMLKRKLSRSGSPRGFAALQALKSKLSRRG